MQSPPSSVSPLSAISGDDPDGYSPANDAEDAKPSDDVRRDDELTPRETADLIHPILSGSGPLAIRHIIAHLTTSYPAFAELESQKQRRLVTQALQLGDSYEKTGWGRYTLKQASSYSSHPLSPPASKPSSFASPRLVDHHHHPSPRIAASRSPYLMPMPMATRYADANAISHHLGSWTLDGGVFPFEADTEDDAADAAADESTDEEDWQSMGASELRRRSKDDTLAISRSFHSPLLHSAAPVHAEEDAVMALVGLGST